MLGGPEDDGFLAPPAMGVGVFDFLGEEEDAQLFELFENDRVGREDVHASEERHVTGQLAGFVDGRIDVERVFEARRIVLFTVSGRNMDRPGAYVLGNVIGVNNEGRPVYEGMPEGLLPEGLRGYLPQDAEVFDSRLAHDIGDKVLHGDQYLASRFYGDIRELRVDGYGEICRQGPWGRRPDEDGYGFVRIPFEHLSAGYEGRTSHRPKPTCHSGTRSRPRPGRFAVDAPEDGLLLPV